MSDILEVLFEDILKAKVPELLFAITALSKNVLNISCSENVKISLNDKESLIDLLNNSEDLCVVINLDEIKLGLLNFKKPIIRLIKYGNRFDIELSFEDEDTTKHIKELHTEIKKLADEYEVVSFFAAMEPVSDKETRYFTGDFLGPLS